MSASIFHSHWIDAVGHKEKDQFELPLILRKIILFIHLARDLLYNYRACT